MGSISENDAYIGDTDFLYLAFALSTMPGKSRWLSHFFNFGPVFVARAAIGLTFIVLRFGLHDPLPPNELVFFETV